MHVMHASGANAFKPNTQPKWGEIAEIGARKVRSVLKGQIATSNKFDKFEKNITRLLHVFFGGI